MGLALYAALRGMSVSSQLGAYVPVVMGAVAITMLERWLPYRREWQPNPTDVVNDVTFMVAVQVLLPQLLSFLAASTLLSALQGRGIALGALWPHHIPALLQAGLMLVVADFFRYWLHRASHRWSPLWRLHAVHHSPQKLYWVNVGRFHPLDKAFQFLLDALPFIVVGVSQEVLSIYFVFYAINGFFQHSNVNARLGWLNYLIAGPELHRWHHSYQIREANQNYGNNLIVWDVLFATRFLPADRQVGDLGLKNRHYPLGFFGQMTAPFVKGMDQLDPVESSNPVQGDVR